MTSQVKGIQKLNPNLQNIIFSFLADEQIPPDQIATPFRDLGRFRSICRAWRDLATPRQETLMERSRIALYPSIPQGPNLLARCSQFFRTIHQNMQDGVYAGTRVESQIVPFGFAISHQHRNHVFLPSAGRGIVGAAPRFIMGDLQDRQIHKRFLAEGNYVQPAITKDGQLVARREDASEHRTLVVWDSMQGGEEVQPSRTIGAPLAFERFCLLDQMIICVGHLEIFFINLQTGDEIGARIPIPGEAQQHGRFGRIIADATKLYLSREGVIYVFNHKERRYEGTIVLPPDLDFPQCIPFNDRLFLIASRNRDQALYAVNPADLSVNLIASDPASDAAASSIPREWGERVQQAAVMGSTRAEALFGDKLALTAAQRTRIYDLRAGRHLMTVNHDFSYFDYSALFDGKLYVAGYTGTQIGPAYNRAFGSLHQVDIFDFNPPQNAQLLAPPVQESEGYFEIIWQGVSDFFEWLWISIRGCLGL